MPIKTIRERENVVTIEHNLIFKTTNKNFYSFPCDHSGKLLEDKVSEAASVNYEKLMTGEIPYTTSYVQEREYWNLTPAVGECTKCSEEVVLEPDNEGLCYCSCGACYNASGQSIRPRSEWEENY